MLRSIPRACPSSASLLPQAVRPSGLRIPSIACLATVQPQQRRAATAHAISNPTLSGIEKRWEEMPPQEQAELWMTLRDRMKVDWHQMTLMEKKAAYWIAFGPHGPRALPPPGQGWRIFGLVSLGVGISFVITVLIRTQARGPPGTMNKEYQEKTNEYLLAQNNEPISGLSSEGYVGKGQVQSKPKKKE